MSRTLQPDEADEFLRIYGAEKACEDCASDNVLVKIWPLYGTTAKKPGGDIGPGQLVAAVLMCQDCTHGTNLNRARLSEANASAAQ